jgi:bile acid-coenzyme A ligase
MEARVQAATTDEVSHAARVAQLANEQPDGPAVRVLQLDGDEPAYTWSELHDRSSQLAAALMARGLGHGDRLALGLRNSIELLLSILAAWKVGAVPVPMRWDLPDWELERVRQAIDPALTITGDDIEWIRATATADVPSLPDAISPICNGICSSGSTGTPKVILQGRPSVYDQLLATPFMDLWSPVPRPETILVPAPMYHTNGFAATNHLLAGDRLVIMQKFDAARVVDAVERYRITTFIATPTMLQRIADLPGVDERDLSSIQWILQGAAPMPASLVHRWDELIGAERIVMAYGMTELVGITALRGDEWMTHPGSVGRGFNGTEMRILDGAGNEVPNGDIGEIYLRSSYQPGSYLGEAPQMPSTEDGYATVGDMGYVDDEGYLYVVDRRVDLIVTGGANVYPAEVEAALIDHPKIADVVVIGLKDPEWGRRVHAVVEPMDATDLPAVDELVAYAKDRLAAYKVPKTVELVDEIPRSAATKVNRRQLVEARGG